MISEWIRVCGIIENRHLLQRHIVFAHYYVNALFHRKMYSELLQLPVAGLVSVLASEPMLITTIFFHYLCVTYYFYLRPQNLKIDKQYIYIYVCL